MKVIIYGASGMVGSGALFECLSDPTIDSVLTVNRSQISIENNKLHQLVLSDLGRYAENELKLFQNYDVCFFCTGQSSVGLSELEYQEITFNLTKQVAQVLLQQNINMKFVYVSAVGADSAEKSHTMWARVRGKTENMLLGMPFKDVYIFRPGVIQPLGNIRSKTKSYQIFYDILKPVMPLFKKFFPHYISSTADIGKAMIYVAKNGYSKKILVTSDFYNIMAYLFETNPK